MCLCWRTQVHVPSAQWGQTETSELRAEKFYCKGQVRRKDSSCLETRNPQRFLVKSFYRQNLGRGMQGVWPPSGWWWGKGGVFQESQTSAFCFQTVCGTCACAQPEVTLLYLGGGSFSSCRRTQEIYIRLLCMSLCTAGRLQDPAPIAALLFLNCFPLFL